MKTTSSKTEPLDVKLWEQIKQDIKNKTGRRWNAYYSGRLVQEYKRQGGKFKTEHKPPNTNLDIWFREKWGSIGGDYPTYRPTIRVNKNTPLTMSEIDPKQAKEQIKLKQQIKNTTHNLPKFQANNIEEKLKIVEKYSDPSKVLKQMKKYKIDGQLFISTRKDKKYMIEHNGKYIHFGQMGFYDYTRTLDEEKKNKFQQRNHKWATADKYTPSYLAYYLLWT